MNERRLQDFATSKVPTDRAATVLVLAAHGPVGHCSAEVSRITLSM